MLLVLVLGVGASFAADTNHTDLQASDDTDTVVSITETDAVSSNDDEVYSAGNDSSVLSATAGSFTDLSTLINSSTTGAITLDKDYTYNSATDSAFVNGIIINRTISIDGAGFTINGNGKARIFHVYGSNVLIRDVDFINGYVTDNTGAILWEGVNGYLVGSTFKNNTASSYAAIWWKANLGTISKCIFEENYASQTGAVCISSTSDGVILTESTFKKNHATNYGALNVNGNNCIVENCIFEENYATESTGALRWQSSQGTLKNCTFNNNYAKNNGAMIFEGTYGIISNCTFNNNYATNNYGAAYVSGASCRLNNCNFTSNHATNNGGAINFASSTGIISSSVFKNNYAKTGGAFYTTTNINVDGCEFYNNTATTAGAYYGTHRSSRVINSIFKCNNATQNGGAMVSTGDVLNSLFEHNIASQNGGAIYANDGFAFNENIFIDNIASNGGGIYVSLTKGYVGNSIFNNNKATNDGGGIYVGTNYLTIINSNFISNNAENHGGGIYISGDYVSVLNSSFSNNVAKDNSGAIFVVSGKKVSLDYSLKTTSDKVNATNIIEFANSIYISPTGSGDGTINSPTNLNTALTDICNGGTIYFNSGEYDLSGQISTQSKTINFVGLGNVCINLNQINVDAIRFEAPMCTIRNIRFKNGISSKYVTNSNGNHAKYCKIVDCVFEDTGRIYMAGRYWTVENCTFINNKNSAIYCQNYNVQTIINCTFINNSATNGGALLIETTETIIANCTFINNSATNNGGAIYLTNYINVISGCYFKGNSATNGGAIYATGQEVNVFDSKFEDNDALNGGALYSTSRGASISDSQFNNNNASNGGALYTTGRDVSVSDSNFTNNNASSSGGAVYSTGTGTSVSGSNFEENSATNGSAVMVGENTDITIEGSDFNGNTGNGSVYVPEGSNFVIDSETTFENNEGGDLVTPGVVSAKVLYVNITATGDGLLVTGPTNWELGFANVQDEGTLYILPGTYDMSQLSPIVVDKSLSIIGLGDVVFTNYVRGQLFDIKADNVKLSNIKFTGITGNYITWDGINGEIESCNFDGSNTNGNYKLIATTLTSTNFKVTNSNFTGFKYTNIINTANYLTTVGNCIFKSNTPYNANSYLIDTTGSDFSISNSEFTSNTAKLVNFESTANRGAISGTTFTGNTVGSGNSLIYISTTGARISGSTFRNSNTGGTYKYIYGTESFALSGNTFEGVTASLNSVSGVTYPNNPTVSGTFNYGVNRANTIPVTANGNLLPNVARSTDATTFSYTWDTPLPNTYTLTFATTDSEGNKYTYTSTPNSVSTTVNRISTVYISPSGTGTGASASSPTTWDNVANLLADTGSVVFTAGTYKLNGKTISKSWKLSNSGTVTIDAENKGRIFTINANNVEISGIIFKNGKVSNNQGSAISWSGTGGKITNSIFNENTGVPISSTNDLTITNTQMKNQISLTKSNINWGATETVKGTFSHSAPSTVTVLFNGNSQGTYTVSSKVATAAVAFTNPSTQAVGSYVVSLTEINNFQVILWSLNQIWSY